MDLDTWSPIAKVYSPLMAGSIDGTDTDPHDKAVIRAMTAKYKPNKDVLGNPENTIFVARLALSVDEKSLDAAFSEFGKIKNVRLVRDIVTGHSRCYGFVEYMDSKSAYYAQREGNRMIIDDKEVFVDFECERTLKGWIPRRLGGGFGGKKESGQLRFGGKDRPFRKPIMVDQNIRPPGETFRERLSAIEDGHWQPNKEHRGDNRSGRYERFSDRDRNSDRYSVRQPFKDRRRDDYRKEDRDSYHSRHQNHSRERSRSKERHRRESRSRSPDRKKRKETNFVNRRRNDNERSTADERREEDEKNDNKHAANFIQMVANSVQTATKGEDRKKRRFQE